MNYRIKVTGDNFKKSYSVIAPSLPEAAEIAKDLFKKDFIKESDYPKAEIDWEKMTKHELYEVGKEIAALL